MLSDVSVEDTTSIGANVETAVNAWITRDDVHAGRAEPMSGVVDLNPWKSLSQDILLKRSYKPTFDTCIIGAEVSSGTAINS